MVDKKELIALKDFTVRELHRIDVGSYNLHEADKRLSSYIIGCIANPTKHNGSSALDSLRSLSKSNS
jgi:hypothetical protein